MGGQLVGNAEGDGRDERREIRIARDALGVHPAGGGEEAEIEGPLLLG